ncbi:restriction endonuclease subunit S [Bacteroides heparinolyticus]|uniref:restriction endonuclease subunit S n=1 Tax=Prevotella heparinolytica TaxID=28113 RepID=UPI00359F8C9F
MTVWKKYTVEQLIDLDMLEAPMDGNHGSIHPKASDYVITGVPFIMVNDMSNGHVDLKNCVFISEKQAGTLRKGFAKPGDVLLSHKATIGRIAIVPNDFDTIILTPQITYYRVKKGIDNRFLKYYFDSPNFQILFNNWAGSGSTRAYLGITAQRKLPIILPELDEQIKIADILSSIDKKIDKNNAINNNLQEQAQALYTNMFIQNNSDQWSEGVLSDVAEIIMGQSPKGDTYNEDGVGTVFFQGRGEFGFRFPTRRLFTTDPKRMAQSNDVLMSVRAPVGDLNIAYEPCCIGRGLGAIRSKDGHQSFVLYTVFSLREKLDMFNGEGTVFGSINRDALNSMPIIIPTKEEIDRFEEIVAPMDAAIRNNYEEICRLEAIRDSLLPRLISGELDVSDIDL